MFFEGSVEGGMCFCLTDSALYEYACGIPQLKSVQRDVLPSDAAELLNDILVEKGIGKVYSSEKLNLTGMNTKWISRKGVWESIDTWNDAMCIWTEYSPLPCTAVYNSMDDIVNEIGAKLADAGLPVPENIKDFIGYASWFAFN
jgi:hypothetical protein